MLTVDRWSLLWQRLGAHAPSRELEALVARYAEPHRHYHTAQHIGECLSHFDGAHSLCERPGEVELALWFHDAIYDPRAKDNEALSAQWALRVMREAGLAVEAQDGVHALIMATRHDALPDSQDTKVLVDIDLSILGADASRFDEYENQVRAEYGWVPTFLFRRKRKEILENFLARASIYATPHFRNQLEKKARDNLARSLSKL
ncbi:MAG: N-methyl-D-aspartate receptor NMDAR2C subunit [Burkholderiales bacterium]